MLALRVQRHDLCQDFLLWLAEKYRATFSVDRYNKRNRVRLEFLNLWSAGPPSLFLSWTFPRNKCQIVGHLYYIIFILLASPVTEQWTLNKCLIGRGVITAVSQLQRLVIEPTVAPDYEFIKRVLPLVCNAHFTALHRIVLHVC